MLQPDGKEYPEDWCFRAETAKLLGVSVAQIHASLTDGNNSVNTLTDSFQELADFCIKVQELSIQRITYPATAREIQSITATMSGKINAAIVAFQFYDRLCQRLEHVAASLNQLSELVGEDDKMSDHKGWEALRDTIKSSYSLGAEHMMYEAIMSGASIDQALSIYLDKFRESEASDDIELF